MNSMKYFVYTDDFGTDFALKADESNTELVNGGVQDYPDNGQIVNELPRNIKPRHLIYQSADGLITRKVYALTQAIYSGAPTAAQSLNFGVGVGTLSLKAINPEKRRQPFGFDTGQTDGDAT